jgi:hypothetical protein
VPVQLTRSSAPRRSTPCLACLFLSPSSAPLCHCHGGDFAARLFISGAYADFSRYCCRLLEIVAAPAKERKKRQIVFLVKPTKDHAASQGRPHRG